VQLIGLIMFGTCNRNECSPLVPECFVHVGSMGCTHSCYMYQTFWDQWAALIPVTCIKHSGINGLHSFLLHVPNILGPMGCTHSCYMHQTFWDQWAALIPVACIKHSEINGLHSFLLHVSNIMGSCNRNECSPLIPECLIHVTGMSAAH
jgi:hypothetical protein